MSSWIYDKLSRVIQNTLKLYPRTTRQSQSRSQVNVSTLLGIDQSYYSKLELGKHDISLETLIKIAELYNVSLDYLTERTDNREINK